MATEYRQSQLRSGLVAVGASVSEDGRKPGVADVLAAIAMCESRNPQKPGWADSERWEDGTLTPWRIKPGLLQFRNEDWLTSSLHNACLAAMALKKMHSERYWPAFGGAMYRSYLPEFYKPVIKYTEEGVRYFELRLLADRNYLQQLKYCDWVCPSRDKWDYVAEFNGFDPTSPPYDQIIRVPNERGW